MGSNFIKPTELGGEKPPVKGAWLEMRQTRKSDLDDKTPLEKDVMTIPGAGCAPVRVGQHIDLGNGVKGKVLGFYKNPKGEKFIFVYDKATGIESFVSFSKIRKLVKQVRGELDAVQRDLKAIIKSVERSLRHPLF